MREQAPGLQRDPRRQVGFRGDPGGRLAGPAQAAFGNPQQTRVLADPVMTREVLLHRFPKACETLQIDAAGERDRLSAAGGQFQAQEQYLQLVAQQAVAQRAAVR